MHTQQLTPVLRTKLQIPSIRPKLLARPHLVEILDEGLKAGNKLTLVSASAGFGKTTLLGEWAHRKRRKLQPRFTWLSLEEDDNYGGRFWAYITASLQIVLPDIGETTMAMLRSPEIPPAEIFLTPMLNEIVDQTKKIVLVLDDFQFIHREEILDEVDYLVDHLPAQLHLVISTRADPALSIVRWRGQGLLTELRGDDLRFTEAEVHAFIKDQLQLSVSDEDLKLLTERMEGWITGLQLAAISMKGRADIPEFITSLVSSPYIILEYLTEEVLKDLPLEVQDFLVQTSILTQLNASLCNRVTNRDDSGAMLATLSRDNLFTTPIDYEHHWYRYHPLFADLLRNRLQQEMDQAQVNFLHQRASHWYEEQGYLQIAVKHALQGGDLERVADLAERAAQASLLDSWMTNLLHWLETLPENVLRSRLRLRIYQACALFFDGQTTQCVKIL
jgi:LuxR family maltose regulon positive regulatory protein